MVQLVESKVYSALPVTRVPAGKPLRAQTDQTDSLQSNAQAFVDTLPNSARERVTQNPGNFEDQRNLSRQSDTSQDSLKATDTPADAARLAEFNVGSQTEGFYSAPVFTADLILIQAQLSAQTSTADGALNALERETSHNAYLNAGAQPGGEGATREAALRRSELANRVQVVPPVLTNVNFVT